MRSCGVFSRVCLVLSMLERHQDSATVYYEAAMGHAETEVLRADFLRMSAQSFDNASCYEQAEDAFVKCFHSFWKMNQRIELNDASIYQSLKWFIGVYAQWATRASSEDCEAFENIETVMNVFVILLTIAGYKHDDQEDDAFCSLEKHFLLKDPYRDKAGARRMLDLAFQTPSAEHFRATIMKCHSANRASRFVRVKAISKDASAKADESTKRAKEEHELLKSQGKAAMTVSCHNPGCSTTMNAQKFRYNTLKYCPCKTVGYCQKSCQAAHWDEHKVVCPYRAKRKKEKQQTKK